jgi:membrane fusion protein (multidrug efflux system)
MSTGTQIPSRPTTEPTDRLRAPERTGEATVVREEPLAADRTAAPKSRAIPRRVPLFPLILALVALVFVGAAARQWWIGRGHVTTDNAQVEGHIVPLLPRVSGFVAEVRVAENEQVQSGQTLVRIDDRDLRARLAQAEADLQNALASVDTHGRTGQAAAQLSAARAAVAQAEANAARTASDLERYQALASRGVVSRQQLETAETANRSAQAQVDASRDQVTAAVAALTGAAAKVEAMRAARDQAALQLSYANVVAPTEGIVSRKNVEVGQLVQAGQPLMSVVPLDDIWVTANLKETEIKDVNPGDAVEIRVDSYPGRVFRGRVESLSPATGAKFSLLPPDNATGNFTKVVQRIPVRIRLDGPQDPRRPRRPGMSATVVVEAR